MSGIYNISFPMTPKMHSTMIRLGKSKIGVMRWALCEHFGIDYIGTMPEIDSRIVEKLSEESKLHKISQNQIVRDIVNAYLARQPTIQPRSPKEIEEEIETKIRHKYMHCCIRYRKNIILCRSLRVSRKMLDRALDHQASMVGRTREEIERDLLCAHLGIQQVVS